MIVSTGMFYFSVCGACDLHCIICILCVSIHLMGQYYCVKCVISFNKICIKNVNAPNHIRHATVLTAFILLSFLLVSQAYTNNSNYTAYVC